MPTQFNFVEYRRTALLIWPEKHDLDIIADDPADYAEQNLNQSDSQEATFKEKGIADTLVTWCESEEDNEGVFDALRTAALRWRDADLWMRACTVVGVDYDMEILGWSNIVEDVNLFGFGAVTELYVHSPP